MPKTINKTYDNALIVWFCKSGSFLLLEQLAAEVFQMLQDELSVDKIVSLYKKNTSVPNHTLKNMLMK